jgi:hypothetical protein
MGGFDAVTGICGMNTFFLVARLVVAVALMLNDEVAELPVYCCYKASVDACFANTLLVHQFYGPA